MPLFSIIVPAYNSVDSIYRCLESILSQDVNDFELVIIDDGSTDLTGAILDDIAHRDARVRVIHNKSNLGVSVTRNKGIDVSQGDYLLFIDSDDFIGQGYLRSIYDSIVANKADIYIWGITKIVNNAAPKVISPTRFYTFDRVEFLSSFLPAQLDCGLYGFVANKAVRRDLIVGNGIRFNTNLRLLEDYDFFLSCYQYSERINVFSLSDYFYILPNVSLNSISRIGTVNYKSLIEVHQKCLNILKDNGIHDDYNMSLMNKTIANLVISAFLEMSPVSHKAVESLFEELDSWIPITETGSSKKRKIIQSLINGNRQNTLLLYLSLRELYHKRRE